MGSFSSPLPLPAQPLLTSLQVPGTCFICIRGRTAFCKLDSDLELGHCCLSTDRIEGRAARNNSDLGLVGKPKHSHSQPLRGGLRLPPPLCPCHHSWRRFYN